MKQISSSSNLQVKELKFEQQLQCLARQLAAPAGGDFHMKQTGMLVFSLRAVNFGLWFHLGCSGQSATFNILHRQGLV